jgi:hypothetical protein
MARIARFIRAVRLLGYIGMCQLVLKDQITWPDPVSPMSRRVTVGVATRRRRGGGGVMVVVAIVLVTFFGAGIVFGLNWIYSRSVRRVPKTPTAAGHEQVDDDSAYQVGPYRH